MSATIGSRDGNITVDYIHLCHPCSDMVTQFEYGQLPNAYSPCMWCGRQPGTEIVDARANDPVLVGGGQVEFSTSLGLQPYRPVVWDVNRYYHELGVVSWSSKREIREAYQRLNGHESQRLTYIVKQLLNDDIRQRYDAVPLGRLWFDHYVAEWVRAARLQEIEDERDPTDMWDNIPDPEDAYEPVETVVDMIANARQEWLSHPSGTVHTEQWAYYVWRCGSESQIIRDQWRGALAKALWDRGVVTKIAAGFLGSCMEQTWDVRPVGYRLVAFVPHEKWPTSEIVAAITDRVVASAGTRESKEILQ